MEIWLALFGCMDDADAPQFAAVDAEAFSTQKAAVAYVRDQVAQDTDPNESKWAEDRPGETWSSVANGYWKTWRIDRKVQS